MQAALNQSRPLARLTQSTTVSSSCFVHCSSQTARLGEGNRVSYATGLLSKPVTCDEEPWRQWLASQS